MPSKQTCQTRSKRSKRSLSYVSTVQVTSILGTLPTQTLSSCIKSSIARHQTSIITTNVSLAFVSHSAVNARSTYQERQEDCLGLSSISDQSFKFSLLTSVPSQLELEPTQRMPHHSTLDYGVASSAAGPRHWTKGSAQPSTSMSSPATVSQ